MNALRLCMTSVWKHYAVLVSTRSPMKTFAWLTTSSKTSTANWRTWSPAAMATKKLGTMHTLR